MAQLNDTPGEEEATTTAYVLQLRWEDRTDRPQMQEAEDLRLGLAGALDDPTAPLDAERIAGLYTCVGTEEFQHADAEAIVGAVWERWNRGSGVESRSFSEADTRSVSVGDIVVFDSRVFLYSAIGYDELDVARSDIAEVLEP